MDSESAVPTVLYINYLYFLKPVKATLDTLVLENVCVHHLTPGLCDW